MTLETMKFDLETLKAAINKQCTILMMGQCETGGGSV